MTTMPKLRSYLIYQMRQQQIILHRSKQNINPYKEQNMNKQKIDRQKIDNQLNKNKIRQGFLLKRSKYMKQWRERWIVLTYNYLITFQNKDCKEITSVIGLSTIKNYTSYVEKNGQFTPLSLQIISSEGKVILAAKSMQQKWSWIVTLQRLLDFKNLGASSHNNMRFVKIKGFPSMFEFQNNVCYLDQSKSEKTLYNLQIKRQSKEEDRPDKEALRIIKKLHQQQEKLEIQKLKVSRLKKALLKQRQQLNQELNRSSLNDGNRGSQNSTSANLYKSYASSQDSIDFKQLVQRPLSKSTSATSKNQKPAKSDQRKTYNEKIDQLQQSQDNQQKQQDKTILIQKYEFK